MSAQLRRSARKRKNLPIVAAASARKKAYQRVPDTMSVTAPQLPTVNTGTPFIPITSSTGTYPMLFSQTGAGIYTSASTGPVDLTSTANTLLYSRVPLPDQRVCNTVTSQDPPEHSLGIGNKTINVKVQKGNTAVFKCPSSGADVTWLGPDVNHSGQTNLVYFVDNNKNSNLKEKKYIFHKNKGGYELVIKKFQKGNSGCYFCRFHNNGLFYETKYNVSLEDRENEATTTSYTAQSLRNTQSFSMKVKTTNSQFPDNHQGNNEQTIVILLLMIPVVLLGGSITIFGVLARVRKIRIDEMLRSVLSSCQRYTERHASNEDVNEQDNTVENQMYQNSNVPPNGRSSVTEIRFPDRTNPDADLGVSEDTGATSKYRNTDESTAVKLYECTPGLHYAEVLITPVESHQIKIHGIENRTIYTEIDHSLKRGDTQSNHSDTNSEDDFIFIQNLDVNCRNYENTCL